MGISVQPLRAKRKASWLANHPRGASAGMVSVLCLAAGKVGWEVSTLLDWKIYPDRVVLISAEGRKVVLSRGVESGKENEVP